MSVILPSFSISNDREVTLEFIIDSILGGENLTSWMAGWKNSYHRASDLTWAWPSPWISSTDTNWELVLVNDNDDDNDDHYDWWWYVYRTSLTNKIRTLV